MMSSTNSNSLNQTTSIHKNSSVCSSTAATATTATTTGSTTNANNNKLQSNLYNCNNNIQTTTNHGNVSVTNSYGRAGGISPSLTPQPQVQPAAPPPPATSNHNHHHLPPSSIVTRGSSSSNGGSNMITRSPAKLSTIGATVQSSANSTTNATIGGTLSSPPTTTIPPPQSSSTTTSSSGGTSINTNCHLNLNSNHHTTHHTSRSNHHYPHPHSSSTFSLNKNEEFLFIKPGECPVFQPNEDEFKNPLAYISKIRPFAEKYGIAKIQPPKSWTPPFTVDVDKLKFTPRVQRLNELEAKTRVKLNFLDQIAKFWELQGSSLKIPMVERKALDLYSLHRIVQAEGGIEQTTKERKWSRVAHRMGYPPGKSIGAILKGHYERILYPFDIFTSGKAIDIKLETEIDDQDYKPHGIVSRQQITPPNETTARRSKRFANSNATKESACGLGSYYPGSTAAAAAAATAAAATAAAATSHIKEESKDEYIGNNITTCTMNEYKRTSMHSYGLNQKTMGSGHCGGGGGGVGGRSNRTRMSGGSNNNNNSIFLAPQPPAPPPPTSSSSSSITTSPVSSSAASSLTASNQLSPSSVQKRKPKEIDPLAKYICHVCNRGDAEENMLLCDGCDDSYHTFCLIPPLNDIPKGDWRCPKCVVEEVNKPTEAFGFEQAQREYTLQQFGEMADQFKADYFNTSVHLVPTELVEREFWRIVSSIDEDVTVEYGADLHTMDHGSGFPTKSSLYMLPGDQEYAESNWNLNNLPLLEESILGHINADISGMKVPWMYVGMCFATFCWHNEDHWSYSINYLHWGEPKTWYGVPGNKAEAFEETMKSAAPELFQSQPDLLHQLVTIMNPNILMKNGVPVYRTDQHAGEFIITFPRAYHAGFNQGYNFAEAVNFAPADWMKMGRECINHYSMLRRFCVFSHDELVCKMALEPEKLNLGIATACYLDMAEMVDTEKKLRKSLLEWGVTKAEREAFELIPDDERQCDQCKTTCFLSAVTCLCTKNLVCLRHYTELCDCIPDKHTLKYRYTLDELPLMLKKLKIKAESFETWLTKVRDVLDSTTPTTITLDNLQNLSNEANNLKFPSSVLLEHLNSAVLEAEKCVTVIQQLDINKMRTRTRITVDSAKYKLTIDELDMFVKEIDNLCCIIEEGDSVRELQHLGHEFINNTKHYLNMKLNKLNSDILEQLIDDGSSLCIELHEVKLLKLRLEQVNWYKRVRQLRDIIIPLNKIPLNDLQTLLKDGLDLTPDFLIQKELVNLQQIVLAVDDWEGVAKKCFESGTQHELPEIEVLLERADDIIVELPSELILRDAVKKAKEWLHTVEILQSNENYPYFHTLENVVNRGRNIPFQLEELRRMEEHLDCAKLWKEKTAKTFLKKQTQFILMDVLSPRSNSIMLASSIKQKPLEEQFTEDMGPVQMVNTFKSAEEKEMNDIRELRLANTQKSPINDKYCICKRKFQGLMFNCQLCKDWFHKGCVPLPKTTVRPRLANQQLPPQPNFPTNNNNNNNNNHNNIGGNRTQVTAATPFVPQLNVRPRDREYKYLCPSCMRSRRPRLETILSLLVSLQRLPIRLPEGEALQCLTERAMNWQDRARTAFATKDVASALAALSLISQKNCDTMKESRLSSRQQATILSDFKKKITGGKTNSFIAAIPNTPNSAASATNTTTTTNNNNNNNSRRTYKRRSQTKTSDYDDFDSSSEDEYRTLHINEDHDDIHSETESAPSSPMKAEHAYSVARPASAGSSNSKYSMDYLDKSDMPLIQLNKSTREFLEELMMEGDLLEVSLDESLHLWRILNAAKPAMTDFTYIQQKYNIVPPTSDILVPNTKKRRSNDLTTAIPAKKFTKLLGQFLSTAVLSVPAKVKRGRKMKMITKATDLTDTLILGDSTEITSLTGVPITSSEITSTTPILTGANHTTIPVNSTIQTLSTNSTNINSTNSNTKKRKRGTGGKKNSAHSRHIIATAASTSDDDEECSAPNCRRPSGREVDWVQCDGGCNKWFHMFCVGLDKNKIKADDDYFCKRCTKKTNSKTGTIPITNFPSDASNSASSSDIQKPIDDIKLSPTATTATTTLPKNLDSDTVNKNQKTTTTDQPTTTTSSSTTTTTTTVTAVAVNNNATATTQSAPEDQTSNDDDADDSPINDDNS